MTTRDPRPAGSRQDREQPIDNATCPAGPVQGSQGKYHAQSNDRDALKYAQGARLKAQTMLGIQGKTHEAGAGECTQEIGLAGLK
jgi:hypothetical protein